MQCNHGFDRFAVRLFALLLLSGLTGLAAVGCGESETSAPAARMATGVAEGVHRPMGKGEAWTWVKTGADGKVETVGISFTAGALEGLPTEAPAVCCGGPEFPLPMPEHAATGGYTHAVIDWNPKGHPPEHIYDVPHFDFHFYLLTEAERQAITATGKDEACCMKPLTGDALPAGYVVAPPAVPQMGLHWGDTSAPEFHGQPFTKTFIYGSYDGKLAFLEPMVTIACLESHPDVKLPVMQPKELPAGIFVPASYGVRYDDASKTYSVTLDSVPVVAAK